MRRVARSSVLNIRLWLTGAVPHSSQFYRDEWAAWPCLPLRVSSRPDGREDTRIFWLGLPPGSRAASERVHPGLFSSAPPGLISDVRCVPPGLKSWAAQRGSLRERGVAGGAAKSRFPAGMTDEKSKNNGGAGFNVSLPSRKKRG